MSRRDGILGLRKELDQVRRERDEMTDKVIDKQTLEGKKKFEREKSAYLAKYWSELLMVYESIQRYNVMIKHKEEQIKNGIIEIMPEDGYIKGTYKPDYWLKAEIDGLRVKIEESKARLELIKVNILTYLSEEECADMMQEAEAYFNK